MWSSSWSYAIENWNKHLGCGPINYKNKYYNILKSRAANSGFLRHFPVGEKWIFTLDDLYYKQKIQNISNDFNCRFEKPLFKCQMTKPFEHIAIDGKIVHQENLH